MNIFGWNEDIFRLYIFVFFLFFMVVGLIFFLLLLECIVLLNYCGFWIVFIDEVVFLLLVFKFKFEIVFKLYVLFFMDGFLL